MGRDISISEARARLPELAHRVAGAPGEVVFIEHRDLDERLALTTDSHIRYLEAMARDLRKKVRKPFVLSGSVEVVLPGDETDEALEKMRKEEGERADAKLEEMLR